MSNITRRRALFWIAVGAAVPTAGRLVWQRLRQRNQPSEGGAMHPIIHALLGNFFAGDVHERHRRLAAARTFSDFDTLTVEENDRLDRLVAQVVEHLRTVPDLSDLTRWSRSLARIERGLLTRTPHPTLLRFACLGMAAVWPDEVPPNTRLADRLIDKPGYLDFSHLAELITWANEMTGALAALPDETLTQFLNSVGMKGPCPNPASDPLGALRLVVELGGKFTHSEQWKEPVRSLPISEVHAVATEAVRVMESAPWLAEASVLDDLFEELALYQPQALAGLTARLARFQSTWRAKQGLIYHVADAATRDYLIGLEGRTDDHSGLLQALAWVGDEVVAKQFLAWRDPERWKSRIYVRPEDYAEIAGWAVTPTGTRRNLCTPAGYTLVKATASGAASGRRLRGCTLTPHQCPHCHQPLQSMLDIDTRQPPFAGLGFRNLLFRLLTCSGCYTLIYATWRPDGSLLTTNVIDSKDTGCKPYPEVELVCQERTASINEWHAALGGVPFWLQDAEYPDCPSCREKMFFLAQLGDDEFGGNGMMYGFACDECNVTATSYQCT